MSILACCVATKISVPRSALEVLAAARSLSQQLGQIPVQVLLMGSGVKEHASTLICHGADKILLVDNPRLEHPEDEVVLGLVEEAVHRFTPQVVLFPHDELGGGHVAPRLAHRLKAGIVTDCTGFDVQDGGIRWLRPVYGGEVQFKLRLYARVRLSHCLQTHSVKAKFRN